MSFLSFLFKRPAYLLKGPEFKAKVTEAGKTAVIVDVRSPAEHKSGAIPKSKNINVMASDFLASVRKLPKDKVYFVYCRSGHRSKAAVQQMKAEGLEAYSLSGGMGNWN